MPNLAPSLLHKDIYDSITISGELIRKAQRMIYKRRLSTRIRDWRQLRKALGISQEAFANYIGLGHRSIWELENGQQKAISHNTENALRAFLNQPKVQRLLLEAGLEHPFPEDVN